MKSRINYFKLGDIDFKLVSGHQKHYLRFLNCAIEYCNSQLSIYIYTDDLTICVHKHLSWREARIITLTYILNNDFKYNSAQQLLGEGSFTWASKAAS